MFGTKIVNDPATAKAIGAVLALFERERIGLELGFYFDNTLFDPLQLDAPERVNIHFHYEQVTIADLPLIEPLIRRDVGRAKALGGAYGIIHLNDYTIADDLRRDLPSYLGKLEQAEAIAERRLTHLHCCFDLGHAKALSASRREHSASDWLSCLHRLRNKGFKIHFHLHNNSGADDEHLSFVESERLGFNGPDRFSGPLGCLGLLARICGEFSAERKIFEVKMELALENLDFVRERLGSVGG